MVALEERRKWWRTTLAPVSLTLRTLQPPWREESTVSQDLSEGGLRFTTLMPLTAGSVIELELVLPFDSLPLCVESAIAWVRERHLKELLADLTDRKIIAEGLLKKIKDEEKTLKEHGDKLPEDDRKEIETAIEEAKKSIESSDIEEMKAASEKLQTATHKLAEVIYQQTADEQGADGAPADAGADAPGGEETGSKEEVVDAEFVDVDKDSEKEPKS